MVYDKRRKMQGTPVSREDVIKKLGTPSVQWSRDQRRLEFEKRLCRGETELSLSAIRGFGGREGYLQYLRRSFANPTGSNTGLVPAEENARILAEAQAEIQAEIVKYEARLAELEQQAEAVETFVQEMRSWLDYLKKTPGTPQELKTIEEEIRDYGKRLEALLRT